MESKDTPIYWLYDAPQKNNDSIIKIIDSLIFSTKQYEITTLILTSKSDIIETIESRKIKNYEYEKKEIGPKIYSFILKKTIRGTKKVRKSKFLIMKNALPYIYILVTHESYKKLNDDIISFFDKFYPKIVKPFITSEVMKKLLENLEKQIQKINIRISKYSSRSRIISKYARKQIESDLKHTDLTLDEAFKKVEDNDEWIKSINFFFISSIKLIDNKFEFLDIDCQISRDGYFKCNKKYSFFNSTIIKNMVIFASEDINLLKDRQRDETEKFKTKPIAIEYNIDIFKERNQIEKLINVLDKIILTSLSVYHANPHLHCSLVDFGDGSSYDIWVLSYNRIIIIPQMCSSYASLERICNNIFMGLKEGIIKDYSD